MKSAELQILIDASKGYVEAIRKWVDGVRLPAEPGSKLAALHLAVGFEHHQAICQLVPAHRVTSAAALLRPQYEAILRGIWVSRCCDDAKISEMLKADKYPRTQLMLEQLSQKCPTIGRQLTKYHEMNWNSFNSLTHGGTLQLMRHVSPDLDLFCDRDAMQALALSNGLTYTSLIEFSVVARNIRIAAESRRYYTEFLVQFEGKPA